MKRFFLLLAILGSLLTITFANASGEETILIRFQIFRVIGNLSGDTSLEEDIWAGEKPPGIELKKSLTFFTSGHFQLGDDQFDINQKGWTWNKVPIIFNAGDKVPLPENRILLFDGFSLPVKNGNLASFIITPKDEIEYFEKRVDGLFELKKLPGSTEFTLELMVKKEKENRIHLSKMKFSLKAVEKREPIPDTKLQIGRPIIQTRDYYADIRVSPDKDYGILLHPGDGQGFLIIRLRAELMEDSKFPQDKSSK